jgi:hypothetical protein
MTVPVAMCLHCPGSSVPCAGRCQTVLQTVILKNSLKGHRFGPQKDVMAAVVPAFEWCICGMHASEPTGNIFIGLFPFIQKNSHTGFILKASATH